jgi:hypothetical protein
MVGLRSRIEGTRTRALVSSPGPTRLTGNRMGTEALFANDGTTVMGSGRARTIYLGEQDTAPVLKMTLLGPDGAPVDLTGATVTFAIRREDVSLAPVTAACTILTPATDGKIEFDWTGYSSGRYDARVKATLANGKQMSFPNDCSLKIVVTW